MISGHFEVYCDPLQMILQEVKNLKVNKLYVFTTVRVLFKLTVMHLNTCY